MLGLAVVLAVAAVFLARNWIQEQARPIIVQQAAQPANTVTVVVAKERMTFGNPVRKEQLRLVKWPGEAVPEGAFTSIDELLDGQEERVVLRAIEINEPVLKNKISGFGGKASLAAILSPEMRAVTIRVNDVAGVAGFVLPGDRVDILLTRDRTGGDGNKSANNLITDVLLQNVKVLGIDQDANQEKDKPSVAKAVTLEVSPQQAQKLALASQLGSLALMLRNLADAEAEQVKTVSTRDLSVGEVNEPAQVVEAPKKKTKTIKKVVQRPKEDPLSAVRIVRGTNATSYEVQPDVQPLFGSLPAQKLSPSGTATVTTPAVPEGGEANTVTPAGPTFVKPQTKAPENGAQSAPSLGGEQENPINLLPPDLEAALN
ncbi:Flp pilus assembly protein CpaB [Pelagibius marinus]|uniref:Flp pilus assembly protein CpaB n=1 Tax=Pelagibius marinus TaxID=2762760 RepID=UPI0018729251|nr:Flp pilus assembly protein CpaB [Pelagibius marinus]